MLIELRGVGFVNKGAELMLHAIIEEVSREIPQARFAMELRAGASLSKLKELGLLAKSNFRRKGLNLEPLINIVPKRIRNSMGFASDREIDVILDGSGFVFGDKWGAKMAGKRAADHIQKWKQQGKKVILLPQAFGPFTQEPLIKKMKVLIKHADLIFARDQVSYRHLTELSPDNPKILQFPDFTNLIQGRTASRLDARKNGIAIIPNQKMRETGNEVEDKAYSHFLKTVVEHLLLKNENPFFLIHEGKTDQRLAAEVNDLMGQAIEIVKEEDPLVVKGIIGSSKAVITSRFHGLVSALSQGIPCLATGWSHKYEMLLQEYSYPEGLCSVTDSETEIADKLGRLLNDESRKDIREKLKKNAEEQKSLSRKMWKTVYQVIK